MGENRDGKRRRMLNGVLQLWNLAPDDKFARVVLDIFGLRNPELDDMSDDEVYGRINDMIEDRMQMIYKTRLHKNPPDVADNISAWMDCSPEDYMRAHTFLDEMKHYVTMLTKREYAQIKEIALHGDLKAARKALETAISDKYGAMARRR
jgi:hypothetical protein